MSGSNLWIKPVSTLLYILVFSVYGQTVNSKSPSPCETEGSVLTCKNIAEFPTDIDENIAILKIESSSLSEMMLKNMSLPPKVTELRLVNCTIQSIGGFQPNNELTVFKIHSPNFNPGKLTVKQGAFDNLKMLVFLEISDYQMGSFPVLNFKKLLNLKISRTNIKDFKAEHLLKLPALRNLYLEKNKFTSLKNDMFPANNQIKLLDMTDNPITTIESNTFKNMTTLTTLKLNGVDIEYLPMNGLNELRILELDRVNRLRTITRTERLEKVTLAKEKSFLCCKLKHEKFDNGLKGPRTFRPHITTTANPTTMSSAAHGTARTNASTKNYRTLPTGFHKQRKRAIITLPTDTPTGDFVTPSPEKPLNCTPGPTAFQPCENIMGADWLTVASFIIGPFALCGNFIVLVVFVCLARNYNVSRFLVTNLALADMTMAIYLLSLVIESVITEGEYYQHVERFQYGFSCKVLGFLAMFSSELSVFSLTLITVERYLTIVYAMYPRYRLTMRTAITCMVVGWIVAITIAILPILGVGSYGKVAICLPFDTDNGGDLYLFIVFGLNGAGFLFICALYAQIYRSVFKTNNSTPTRGHDSRVARRMALLVFTDFACFAPIAITGISALLGHPLINVTESKYLLVFFFPLNGLLNPFLYAIITKPFRRDLAVLLKNCFVCGESLTNYISGLPTRSMQSTNDVLSPSARPSLDFNAMGNLHSLANIRGSRENPVSASFSKSEPNLVRFSQEGLNL